MEDGNAACAEAARQAEDVEQPSADSAEAVAAYANAVLPIARDRLDALEELEPPDDLERFHERLLTEQEQLVAAVETLADAAERDDRVTAGRAATEGAGARQRSRLLFQQLGLTRCAESEF
ncbi:MAG TPA: hypothetical protein VK874_08755 [Gaiellaceae bacterium]|nr:hypothetical protein [Gaiellaceae bacterium]